MMPGTSENRHVRLQSSNLQSNSSASSLGSLYTVALRSASGIVRQSEEISKSLICRAFVPLVAVHVSNDTDELARDKGFSHFQEMLRPYGEDLPGRLTVRDSVGCSHSYDDFGVRFVRLTDVAAAGERWESEILPWANNPGEDGRIKAAGPVFVGGSIQDVEELVEFHLDRNEDSIRTTSVTTGVTDSGNAPPLSDQPFYSHYLRRLLSALPVCPHETFSHPVACIIAISSRNPSPIETLRNLYASGNQLSLPKYVSVDYLRYYLLVHDEDKDDIGKSTALFDQMKKHFGLSCHLLRLRSGGKTAVTDDDAVVVPTSQWRSAAEELASIHDKDSEEKSPLCLPETDASGIRSMVREMAQISVVPFMERCIATWNAQVASRRRGISGRFLSMSKRYFGTTSSRNSSSTNYHSGSASYPPSSPEAQMRKLADFAFMLRDWKLAHNVYDLLRTDFNNDKAWKFHAAAHEMTALSLVLTDAPLSDKVRQETVEPILDLACYSYVTRCSAPYSALRCLLVAVELLRSCGGAAVEDAAKWAIRARETQPIGIGHALITERVGACYAIIPSALAGRRRKTAMWKILAAHEWVLTGKAARARYCLHEALPVYKTCQFNHIVTFTKSLQYQAGYSPLMSSKGCIKGYKNRDYKLQRDGERLELGCKKQIGMVRSGDMRDLREDIL
ncbi:ER-golgi trafficking TRAPP I complex 85 kDa subunit-domain-containing protein [Trichophaea hybrida]|nr:ER-golgi trafficking TRAPP I complex 85 kDa subunit-domain-containing protein [Trichophaea hybrida]